MSSPAAVQSLRFAARLATTNARELIERDQARAQKLLRGVNPHGSKAIKEARLRRRHHHHHHHDHGIHGGARDDQPASGTPPSERGVDVTDAGVTYTISMGVGNPPNQYSVLIDTGSSNTWVGADKKYVPTSTSQDTGNTVSVTYGSGSFSGEEYTDQVTLGSGIVIKNQSIGVAQTSEDFAGVDGILGIGPTDLTSTTVSSTSSVATVTDNLFAQGVITEDTIGISFEPTATSGAVNGELTFGGTDSTKYVGDITYVPITSTSPASAYWGITQDVSYGQGTPLLSGAPGIVDTGTTLCLIASDAFETYQKATGGTLDSATGLLSITEDQFKSLQSLYFSIGGATFEMTPDAQIWPTKNNSQIGGEEGKIYLVVSDMGTLSGQGLDYINGYCWLQRFYSVYDTANEQVGIANTPFTGATTNYARGDSQY